MNLIFCFNCIKEKIIPSECNLNKIKLLEKDGYDKMVSGVKAWRQNEVNRLYIKIGQEALLKDLSLQDVIVERQKRNMPYLKIEEINAISKLNGRLSF